MYTKSDHNSLEASEALQAALLLAASRQLSSYPARLLLPTLVAALIAACVLICQPVGFFFPSLVSHVPLTSSLQQNKQAMQECSRQKGCLVFDLNTYIFFLVKTCDIHQTHPGRL